MLANQDLRKSIRNSEVYMYQIAETLGIHENTLYRLLRKELSIEQKTKVLEILKELELNSKDENRKTNLIDEEV